MKGIEIVPVKGLFPFFDFCKVPRLLYQGRKGFAPPLDAERWMHHGTKLNPQFTLGINGMEEREGRALLDQLFHQALVPEYQFRMHWTPHTIAMWDNRSTQHYAVHDYYPQRRYMERVTIKGGPVTGVPKADPTTVRRLKYVAPAGTEAHGGHKPH